MNLSKEQKFLWISIAVIVFLNILFGIFLVNNTQSQLEECRKEATAWYNATTAQADEFYYYMLRGQQPGTLNHDVSHIFIAQGHELGCIQPKLPPG